MVVKGSKIAKSIILLLAFCYSSIVVAQKDSSIIRIAITKDSIQNPISTIEKDSTANSVFAFRTKVPIPKRAAMFSALLPGLGQAYNRQYWKIGLVAVGAGVSTYYISNNYSSWTNFREAFIARTDNNPNTIDKLPQYTTTDLRELERNSRENLDRAVLYSSLVYGFNILDALVSAHLRNFDIGKDISLHIHPSFQNTTAGIALQFKMK